MALTLHLDEVDVAHGRPSERHSLLATLTAAHRDADVRTHHVRPSQRILDTAATVWEYQGMH